MNIAEKPTNFWLATRNDIPCEVFFDRKDAVMWLKNILKQTLKDFDSQDKTNEFDYEIDLQSIKIKRWRRREPDLGL